MSRTTISSILWGLIGIASLTVGLLISGSPSPPAHRHSSPPKPAIRKHHPWLVYGGGSARRRRASYGPSHSLNSVWAVNAPEFVEFSPTVSGRGLYYTTKDGIVQARSSVSGRLLWERKAGKLAASAPALSPRTHSLYQTMLSRSLLRMSMRDGRILWQQDLEGRSESSPLLDEARGRLYVGVETGAVECFSMKTGKLIWSTDVGGAVKGAPAGWHKRIIVGTYDGRIVSLNPENGRVGWSSWSDKRLLLDSRGGFYATPTITRGRVIVGNTDGQVYAFSARTGGRLWKASTGGYVYSAAAVIPRRRGGWLVAVGSYDHNVYGLSIASGRKVWHTRLDGRVSGAVTSLGPLVWAQTTRGSHLYGLRGSDGRLVIRVAGGGFEAPSTDGVRIYQASWRRIRAWRGEESKQELARDRARAKLGQVGTQTLSAGRRPGE